MTLDYNEILSEIAALSDDGMVDFTDAKNLELLREALRDRGVDQEFITEYVQSTYESAQKLLIERDRAAKEAHKMGLHAAGGYRWANKSGVVTHVVDTKLDKLIPLNKKQSAIETEKSKAAASGKGGGEPAGKEGGEKEQPQQKKPAGPNTVEPGANVGDQLQDMEGTKKKVKEIESYMKQIAFESKQDAAVFSKTLEFLRLGDFSVLAKNKNIINKYMRIGGDEKTRKVYLAIQKAGDFRGGKPRQKIQNIPPEMYSALSKFGVDRAAGVVLSGGQESPVTKKMLTAGELFKGEGEITQTEVVLKSNGLQVGKQFVPKYKEPNISQLEAAYKKKGAENPKEEARVTLLAIQRRNKLIDIMGKKFTEGGKTYPFVSPVPGVTPDTPQGRKKIIDAVADRVTMKLKEVVPNPSPEIKGVMADLQKLKVSKNIGNDSLALLAKFRDIEELKTGAPDVAELFTYMRKLQEGMTTYLPGKSNLPLADIIAFSDAGIKANPSADEFVKASQAIFISVDYLSIKMGAGGAGTMRGKIDFSEFKSPNTKKQLYALQDTDKVIFDQNSPDTAMKTTLAVAKAAGVDVKAITSDPRMKKSVDAAWKRWGKKPPMKQSLALYRKQLETYYVTGLVLEQVYNKDLNYQLFFNERYASKGEHGPMRREITDGIRRRSLVKTSFNSGKFNSITGKPANIYPGKFHDEGEAVGDEEENTEETEK